MEIFNLELGNETSFTWKAWDRAFLNGKLSEPAIDWMMFGAPKVNHVNGPNRVYQQNPVGIKR